MSLDKYGAGTPAPVTDVQPRCWKCGKLLAEMLTRPWRIRCSRCKSANMGGVSVTPREGPQPED